MIRQGEKPEIVQPVLPAVSGLFGFMEALQGLQGNTLVAGKTTALRLFADAGSIANAANAEATVLRPDGSRRTLSWATGSFTLIPNSSAGPTIAVTIPGTASALDRNVLLPASRDRRQSATGPGRRARRCPAPSDQGPACHGRAAMVRHCNPAG